jgi:hypothetical protein
MGYGSWSSSNYVATSADYRTQTREQLFSQTIAKDFDPKGVTVRESCDSDDSPESNAIIVALDVTGSMGFIAEHIAKNSLGTLVEGILETKPVSNPHIMMMGIGDINYDDAPLQVTQFEVDIRIAEQLTDLWLEGGGGGNNYESYDLAWIFAAHKTKIDCFEKRGKKGYLFTIGDEEPPITANAQNIKNVCDLTIQQGTDAKDVLAAAQEKYEVFHIIVEEGSYASYRLDRVEKRWKDLIGKRAVLLSNYKHLSEVILSVMRVSEGADAQEVIDSWQDESTKDTVRHALFD